MLKYALSDVRVLDFSMWGTGPEATLLLGLLGAEIIKVESRQALDPMRSLRQLLPGDINSSYAFNEVNLNKLGVTLNLKHSKGVELAKRLAGVCGVVVENFRPGVMDRLGLGYPALREANPKLIMISISGYGQTGPERENPAFASIFGAVSGLSNVTGYPDGPPVEMRLPMDMVGGTAAAFALMAALVSRQTTGEGRYIDLSVSEVPICFIGEMLLDYFLNGRIQSRKGNRDEAMAPHNCYPCRGTDKWISIAVSSREEWEAFCVSMGKPGWASEERFADTTSRWKNQDELDKLISAYTVNYNADELTKILQGAGVAAFPSLDGKDLYRDPHLTARHAFTEVEHPLIGKIVTLGPPWKLSETPAVIRHRAPFLGEYNEYVFGTLLGMSKQEVSTLIAERVIT